MRRHTVLRSSYKMVDGVGHQVIAGEGEYPLDYERVRAALLCARQRLHARARQVDCTGWSHHQLTKYMLDETYRVFDLERGPIMRLRFLTAQGSSESYLLWTCHHIAVDLWSYVVLLDELGKLYSLFVDKAVAAHHELSDGELPHAPPS
jgi:hypothetical protein